MMKLLCTSNWRSRLILVKSRAWRSGYENIPSPTHHTQSRCGWRSRHQQSIFHHTATLWGVTHKTVLFCFSCLDHTLLGLLSHFSSKESSWHFGYLSRISFCLLLHGIWLPFPRHFSPAFLCHFPKHALWCLLCMWLYRMLLQCNCDVYNQCMASFAFPVKPNQPKSLSFPQQCKFSFFQNCARASKPVVMRGPERVLPWRPVFCEHISQKQ